MVEENSKNTMCVRYEGCQKVKTLCVLYATVVTRYFCMRTRICALSPFEGSRSPFAHPGDYDRFT